MTQLQSFISAVTESRVLSDDQKKELLLDPESLPEAYRKRVGDLLVTFDIHSRIREEILHTELAKSLNAFEKEIAASDISDDEKKDVLDKAKKQIAGFFPA